jgi:hypothetical protein
MTELSQTRSLHLFPFLARARALLSRHRTNLRLLALVLLCCWVASNWYHTVERMVRYYTPLPAWDYWRTAALAPSYRAYDFRVLWHQHNEHRIVFPEIVFAADYLLWHGRELLPLAVSFLCYFANWIVLTWAFWSNISLPGFVRKIGILLAGIIIGWQGSVLVLSDPFLLQWTMSQLAVLLSLAFLARLKEIGRNSYAAALIVCAVIATYSSGNGLLLWLVLIPAAILVRISRRHVIGITVAALLSIGLYFIGYQFTGTVSIITLLRHPIHTLEFVASYVSMPFGVFKSAIFGVCLGLGSLSATALLLVVAARRHVLASRSGVVLFGFYMFLVLTGLLIAAGRMHVNDSSFQEAKPARYVTGPLVGWAVFILLCLWLCSRSLESLRLRVAIAFLVAALLLIAFPKFRLWLQGADAERARVQLAAVAIELGIQDDGINLNLFPESAAVNFWMPAIRDNHLSVFYKPRSKWLGRPIRDFAIPAEATVPGEITYTFPVLGGVELSGWVDTAQLRTYSGWLLLANEAGRIAGFGRKLPAGFPYALENPRTPFSLGWVGFANLKYPAKSIRAYLIRPAGLFPLAGSMPVPDVQLTTAQEAGPRIPGLSWHMDNGWAASNLPQNRFFGQAPQQPFYSTWGDDTRTGRITSSVFSAPANACVILPELQGPRADHLFAGIVDSDTNQVIAEARFQNTAKAWTFWRFPLPDSAKRLRIVAEDNGRAWGEWLAIGNPSLCR